MKYTIAFIFLLSFSIGIQAQQTPAPPQAGAVLIVGAKAHLGNGEMIENSLIGFVNGQLSLIADARTAKVDRTAYATIIEAGGKHVYPGFIAANTQLGLSEIDAVRSTRDHTEVGGMNPNVRSLIAFNTDSRVSPTVRSNGVLMAQITPRGGRISGQSSLVQLDAWNWEDAAYAADEGIHLNWPASFVRDRKNRGRMKKSENYAKQLQEVIDLIEAAKTYTPEKTGKTNLKLAAMKGLLSGEKTMYVHTQSAKSMMEAIPLMANYGIRTVIVGGREAWMIPDFLKNNNVSVVLRGTQSLPARRGSDIDQPFKTAKVLEEAGVVFCFSVRGGWQQRNLPFQAGQAVGFGLPYESAVKGLTLNTARIMGVDKKLGSLEEGKSATLFICEGDALDMRTCKVKQAFIDGREIDLDNKQKALYRKFEEKYKQEK